MTDTSLTDMGGNRMEAPATPPGWEDAPERLYTIDAPDGRSRAWVWRLVRQAPTHIVCELRAPDDLAPEQAAAYPFTIRVLVSITIENHQLDVRLTAYNEGDEVAPLGMGLHPYIGEGVLGPDRSV